LQAVGLDVKSIKDVTPYRITGAGLLRPAGYRNEEVEKDMKYTGPSCRICRRSGVKLFLKGEKCLSPKCPWKEGLPTWTAWTYPQR